MDLASSFSDINWLSVIISAISAFLTGGIWYGPLFGRLWMAEFGFTEEDLKKRSVVKTFGVSLLLSLIAAIMLEMFIRQSADMAMGLMAGFLAGVGWVATFTGIQYVFEMKSLKIFMVNAGYSTVSLTLMGAILGAW